MKEITIRVYEELNDYIPYEMRKKDIKIVLEDRISIQELVSLLGIPKKEVDLVLCDGDSVEFDYVPEDQSRVSLFPVFESLDISGITRLRNSPLRQIRLLTDYGLNSLYRELKMRGFDVILARVDDEIYIIKKAIQEDRIILTKRDSLIKRYHPPKAICIRYNDLDDQIMFLIERLNLQNII